MKWRKIALVLLSVAVVATVLISAGNNSSEGEILSLSNAYTDAYNRRDINKLLSFWSDDASYQDLLNGDIYEGKEEIEQFFKDEFADDSNGQLSLKIEKTEAKSPDKLIATGLAVMTYKDKPEESSAFSAEYVNKNGSWLIQKLDDVALVTPTSNYDYLKGLDWLIGNWEDQDPNDNVDVKSSFNWELNKNYIIQQFEMSILGHKDIEGRQIIAWDPVAEQIRSWIFDSDGGFGESKWSKEGDKWYANLVFNMPSGVKASATHIYSKVDDNSFTFASVNRDAGGDLLPDIGPFKVIRKK